MDATTFYISTIGHCLGETFWQHGLSFAPPKSNTDEMEYYNQAKYIRVLIISLAWLGIIGFIIKNDNKTISPVYLIANSIIFNVSTIFPREATIVYAMGFILANMSISGYITSKIATLTSPNFMYHVIQIISDIHIFDDKVSEIKNRRIIAMSLCAFIMAMHIDLCKNIGFITSCQLASYLAIIVYNCYLLYFD
jgi:hypothetical protein